MATVLVTGANRGIGLELCRLMSERGDTVIGACRSASEELQALGVRVEEGVDVADEASIKALDERLGDVKLDVLVNNAGILTVETLGDLDFDRIRRQFEINSLGPLKVTLALRHRLGEGGKVAIVTSRMGSIDDNTSGSYYGYRMSKAAVNMAGRSLSHDLRGDGIAVGLLHPGMVSTAMTGFNGIQPSEAAEGLLARIDELNLSKSGTFWHANGEPLPW